MSRARLYNKPELEKGWDVPIREIDLSAFKKNPVMFYKHHRGWDDPGKVIGKWTNLRASGDNLIGEPIFDLKDDHAKEIARKWNDDILRAVSVGGDYDPDTQIYTVKECSIVDVPLSPSSLKLSASINSKNKHINSWKIGNHYQYLSLGSTKPLTADHMSSENKDLNKTAGDEPTAGNTEKKEASQEELEAKVRSVIDEKIAELDANSKTAEKEAEKTKAEKDEEDEDEEYAKDKKADKKAEDTETPSEVEEKVEALSAQVAEITKKAHEAELKVKEASARELFAKAKEAGYPGIDAKAEFSAEFLKTYLSASGFLTESVNAHIAKQPEAFRNDPELKEAVATTRFNGLGGTDKNAISNDPDAILKEFALKAQSQSFNDLVGIEENGEDALANEAIKRLEASYAEEAIWLKAHEYEIKNKIPVVLSHHKEAWDKINRTKHLSLIHI